jgi:hypothetical protein
VGMRSGLERGERRRKGSGRVGAIPVRNSDHGEGNRPRQGSARTGGGGEVLWIYTGTRDGARLAGHRVGHGEQTRSDTGETELATVMRE